MRESRSRGTDRIDTKGFKHARKYKKDITKRRNVSKRTADEDDDDAGSVAAEVDTDTGEMQSMLRTCSSPVKSECSEEGSGTDLSASSSVHGGNGSQSSSRSNQSSNSAKKQGISGITFQPGTRLEAKDLGNGIWYAVKVVEVDWEEEEILIHFEKWSQRYDEWIPMDSSRLRPVMEPPGGIAKKTTKIFKVGDKVMATWSDSRKYPATVKTILGNDRYEVLFFDGFSKNIKGGRMTFLKDEELAKIQELKPGIGPSNDVASPPMPVAHSSSQMINNSMAETLGTKEERRERKRKLNVAELFHFKKRPRVDSPSTQASMESVKKPRRGSGFGNRGRKKDQWVDEAPTPSVDSLSHVQVKIEPNLHEMPEENTVGTDDSNAVLTMEHKKRESLTKGRGRSKSGEDFDKTIRKPRSDTLGQRADEERKSMFGRKIGRKFNKYRDAGRRTQSAASSRKDSEVQRRRKKEGDGETTSKPARAMDDWEPVGEPAYIVDGTDGPRKSIIVADPRIPPGWTRHTIQRMSGHSAGKWDVFFVCPEGRKFRTRHELRLYYDEHGEMFPSEQFDFSLGRRKNKNAVDREGNSAALCAGFSSGLTKMNRQMGPTSAHLNLISSGAESMCDTPVRRVKTLLPRVRTPGVEGVHPPAPHGPLGSDFVDDSSFMSDDSVVLGGLKIQKENDAFRCPKEGCNKNFRKENLLQMHMKHYHPEYNRFVASTPNVADLAYARTVGESLEDLHPRTPRPSILDKISRFEAMRRARATTTESGVSSPSAPVPTPMPPTVVAPPDPSAPAPPLLSATPKPLPGGARRRIGDGGVGDSILLSETSDAAMSPSLPSNSDHGEASQSVVRTLLPVIRSTPAEPMLPLISSDICGDTSSSSVGQSVQNAQSTAELKPITDEKAEERESDLSSLLPGAGVSHTKSLRTVRRRHMSDFHMEPLLKKRKSDAEDSTQSTVINGSSSRQTRTESLRREELINCTCGYPEEDGLMIQCDLCMCWQHGLCNNIEHEDHVPEKYVCFICQNPPRERRSKHYIHDQDWLKEGRLPSLSFRSKDHAQMAPSEALFKRSHDLTGSLLQLQSVIHSLRVKVNIAEKKDHPKLYLWAHSWEKTGSNSQNQFSSDIGHQDGQRISKDIRECGKDTSKQTADELPIGFPKRERNCSLQTSYESTMGDTDGDVAEHSLDLVKEENDVCLPSESGDQLADECDTKDTYFSQDTTGSVKEGGVHEEKKLQLETNPKSSDEKDVAAVGLENSLVMGKETEDEVNKGDDANAQEENDGASDMNKLDSIEKQSNACLKEEITSTSATTSTSMVSGDMKPDLQQPASDDIVDDIRLSLCESGLVDVTSSMSNPLSALDVSVDLNREPVRKAVQCAPQPEAPIDPAECRLTLLDHIELLQQQVEARLASIESQIDELESTEQRNERVSDSHTKESVQMLMRDFASLHDIKLESMEPHNERASDSRTKESVQMLMRDLASLHDIANFN